MNCWTRLISSTIYTNITHLDPGNTQLFSTETVGVLVNIQLT